VFDRNTFGGPLRRVCNDLRDEIVTISGAGFSTLIFVIIVRYAGLVNNVRIRAKPVETISIRILLWQNLSLPGVRVVVKCTN
jgi:hypothetical protein